MRDTEKLGNTNAQTSIYLATARWTSTVYGVQFGQVALLEPQPDQTIAFQMSAWGLSKGLRTLLADYSDAEVSRGIEWLMTYQTILVVNMLEQISMESRFMPSLEQIFLSIDAELFLPRGLRMSVTCITNIVPRNNDDDGLDKFVAVLDPSEAQAYIQERRGLSLPNADERVH